MKKNIVKWLLITVYLITALVIWFNREVIYLHMPSFFFEPTWFVYFIDAVIIALMLTIFVCIIQLFRCPPFERLRFQKVFKQIGLHNRLGEYPALLSKKIDKGKKNGYIYKLQNIGIPMDILDNMIYSSEHSLHLKVNHIEYGRKAKTVLLYAVPDKYAKPEEISLSNRTYEEVLCKLPNLLCVGQTGSGKSYALSVILAIYARAIPDVSITISDYKHSLLAPLAHSQNYYGYDKAVEGITLFYEEFKERLAAHDPERNNHTMILLIDEYSALIGSQDKKGAEELKTMVGNMLLMSRSLGMKIIVGMQTAHSEHFKTGARDQFHGILALGNLSKEQKQMLCPDYKEKMGDHNSVGEGYLLINEKDIERVKISKIKDMETLIEIIRPTMNR